MADTELVDLPDVPAPALTDILYMVTDPGGTPADGKVTRTALLGSDLVDLITRWVAASASGPASLAIAEDTDNGSNTITVTVPAAVGGDRTFTLQDVSTSPVTTEHGGLETVVAHGNTGATETIDISQGNVHTAAQDQACVYTFSGATASKGCSFTLILTSVSGAATWPASVKWPDATAPTLSGVTIITFITTDGGTVWYGMSAGKAFA